MKTWYANVSFDGMWIDMSEVFSFCVGSCGSGNLTLNPVHPPFSLPGEPGNIIHRYPEGFNITNAIEFSSIQAASSSAAAAASSAAAAKMTSTTNAASSTSSLAPSTISTSYIRTKPTPGVRAIEYPP